MRRLHAGHAGVGDRPSGAQSVAHRKRRHGRDRRRALPLHRLSQDHHRRAGCRFRASSRSRRPRLEMRWARDWCGSTARARWMARRFLAPTKFQPERCWSAQSAVRTSARASVSAILTLSWPRIRESIRVLTAKDIPGENRYGVIPRFADQPVFAEVEARFRGEAVAAVVGEAEAIEALDFASFPVDLGRAARADHDCRRART